MVFHWFRLTKSAYTSIKRGVKQYEEFLTANNNTSRKEVWTMYDHITSDLFEGLFNETCHEMMGVLGSYLDSVIKSEFDI